MKTPLPLLLNRAQRAIRRRAAAKSTSNLTNLQAGVLFLLDGQRGARFGDVARTLKTTAPRLSELVHRMEDAGLITRVPDPNDGRAQSLMLTPDGRSARRVAVEALVDLDALMTESFTVEEVAVVARWLETVQIRCDSAMRSHA